MTLTEYRRKRRFDRTPEPDAKGGGNPASSAPIFVVQKHDASRLHFDFRLEHDGVLLSWAVPKGPSLDPADKALAVHVEDHPIEYAQFEGVIPKGQYGGGTVMLWDRGTWTPRPQRGRGVAGSLQQGSLKFELHGQRLRGGFTLVKLKGRGRADAGKENWLLIKERDDYASDAGRAALGDTSRSVATGRTMDEIAADRDAVWDSHAPADEALKVTEKRKPSSRRARTAARLPEKMEAQLATLVSAAPAGGDYVHEVKFDGYRILARLDRGTVRLFTRQGNDWTDRFPSLAAALAELPTDAAWLDGEAVVLAPDGTTSFQALQNVLRRKRKADVTYYAFDLLLDAREDLRDQPLEERKRRLRALVPRADAGAVRFSDHVVGQGPAFFEQACRMGLEGVVSKRRDAAYTAGRGKAWLKSKCGKRQELVIVGYTPPGGSRSHFGSLLMGYHDDEGRLIYAGRVGTGFTEATLRDLHARLRTLEVKTPPLHDPPRPPRGTRWVRPQLVAEVAFTEWTEDGHARHPSFQGLREDKPAADVRRESPTTRGADMVKSNGTGATKRKAVTIAGVALSHPDRVLYAEQGVTKADLAQYMETIAPHLLPHVAGRPLSLVRCPAGQGGECFFQKHHKGTLPEQVKAVDVDGEPYVTVDDAAGLVALIQVGTLEVHPWGSRAESLDRPDVLTFDLDPGEGVPWEQVKAAAVMLRDELEKLGLASFLKTSGGKGLHVQVPIERRATWEQARAFCAGVAKEAVRREPALYVANIRKALRTGKVLIDYFRNNRGSTSVAAYSPRARPGAPVSAPLQWAELDDLLSPTQYNVTNTPALVARRSDPYQELLTTRQRLTAAMLRAVGE